MFILKRMCSLYSYCGNILVIFVINLQVVIEEYIFKFCLMFENYFVYLVFDINCFVNYLDGFKVIVGCQDFIFVILFIGEN